MSGLSMAKEKTLINKVDLDTSVSEQIADMQLMHLRAISFERQLSFDEIKTLEILSKVKNNELEMRQPEDMDPKKAKAKQLAEMAANTKLIAAPEPPKKEVVNDKAKRTISKT